MSDYTIDSMVTITGAEYERMRAEIERLNRELDDVWDALAIQREDNASFGDAFKRMTSEIERLRAALRAARVAVEDWASYASDFYREKWDLQGDLAHIDAALAEENKDDR